MTDSFAPDSTKIDYIGDELQLFENAQNWKAYFANRLKPFICGSVAEVGAGLGGTTRTLCSGDEISWAAIEPDPCLCREIKRKVADGELPANVKPSLSVLADRPVSEKFDTILYIDVLEHIEEDANEAARAAERLRPGGHLVVLAPAHQFLFTPFDSAIGHYRRYSRASLRALSPPGLTLQSCFYLDSVGMLASLANKLLLSQSHPKLSQILLWDRAMVPVSRIVDPLLLNSLGKTVVAIWRHP
ncbi:MAG: class I SAM-dependent methyltransferase [Hyphomonas sp.]|uniref:class I SAM-dependent methyltransferase n=1 Tax=Hyphomonas sp. TaxID=87 RepID=UPI003266CE39